MSCGHVVAEKTHLGYFDLPVSPAHTELQTLLKAVAPVLYDQSYSVSVLSPPHSIKPLPNTNDGLAISASARSEIWTADYLPPRSRELVVA